jgi:DNA-binding CsgD family transcriptional regulator
MTSRERRPGDLPHYFTARQKEIVALVASGLSDKQIAACLGVSPRTVRTHLERLFHAHALHSRSAAVAEWLQQLPSP